MLAFSKTKGIKAEDLLITNLIKIDTIMWKPDVHSRKFLFYLVSKKVSDMEGVSSSHSEIFDELMERNRLGPATIDGVNAAVPHIQLSGFERPFAVFVELDTPIDFGLTQEGQAASVSRLFFLMVPEGTGKISLCHLAILAEFLINEDAQNKIEECNNGEEVYLAIKNWENDNLPFFKYFIN